MRPAGVPCPRCTGSVLAGVCLACGWERPYEEQQGWRLTRHEDDHGDVSWLIHDDSRPGSHIDTEVCQIWQEADANLILAALQRSSEAGAELEELHNSVHGAGLRIKELQAEV